MNSQIKSCYRLFLVFGLGLFATGAQAEPAFLVSLSADQSLANESTKDWGVLKVNLHKLDAPEGERIVVGAEEEETAYLRVIAKTHAKGYLAVHCDESPELCHSLQELFLREFPRSDFGKRARSSWLLFVPKIFADVFPLREAIAPQAIPSGRPPSSLAPNMPPVAAAAPSPAPIPAPESTPPSPASLADLAPHAETLLPHGLDNETIDRILLISASYWARQNLPAALEFYFLAGMVHRSKLIRWTLADFAGHELSRYLPLLACGRSVVWLSALELMRMSDGIKVLSAIDARRKSIEWAYISQQPFPPFMSIVPPDSSLVLVANTLPIAGLEWAEENMPEALKETFVHGIAEATRIREWRISDFVGHPLFGGLSYYSFQGAMWLSTVELYVLMDCLQIMSYALVLAEARAAQFADGSALPPESVPNPGTIIDPSSLMGEGGWPSPPHPAPFALASPSEGQDVQWDRLNLDNVDLDALWQEFPH